MKIEKNIIENCIRQTNENILKWKITRPDDYINTSFIRSLFLHYVQKDLYILSKYDFNKIKKLINININNESFIKGINISRNNGKYLYFQNIELVTNIENIFISIDYNSLIPYYKKEVELETYNVFNFNDLNKITF